MFRRMKSTSPALFPFLAVLLAGLLMATGCSDSQEKASTDKTDHAGKLTPRYTREAVTMEKMTYPESKTVEQNDDYHGTKVADPYRWLEDVDSDETHDWVERQNEVTFGFLESIGARQKYADRLTEVWDYAKYSAPFKEGGRTFFYKNDGLQNQSVLYVQDSAEAEPRILLDPNKLSEDGTVALGGASISRDGKYMAWSISVSGSDWNTWYVRDIATGQDFEDKIEWSKFSGASWDQDARGFYYSRYEAPREGETFEGANYFQKLYYHRLDTSQDEDILIYERPDEKEWGFGGDVSEDGRYLLITVWQGTSHDNRLYYKDLRDRSLVIHELLNENDAKYTFLGNDGPVFFIRTNKDAPKDRIIAIDITRPEPAHWKTIIPEGADPIDGARILDNSFVINTMHDVVSVVKVYDLDGTYKNEIRMPGLGSVGGFSGHPEDTDTYYVFNSYLNPSEIHHYDFRTRKSTLFRKPDINFDFTGYETEQVFFKSKDGTKVPMFIVHKKGLDLNGTNPTILYGYGGFNISLKPRFRTSLLPWLEQGGVYAVANLRGGGEYGEEWHQSGILENKQNVFDDFIAAAKYLISEGYTNPNKLAVSGASNGGTLVGAVVNQRPELFGAALPGVGVMDMLRFQHFTIGWAWTSDFGSSEDPEMFPVLYAYSPYHNLKPGVKYPAVMITTADHDDRVVPGHSFKYAARLQACQAGNLPTLIRIQTKAGHGGGKPTAMLIEELADSYAFLHKVLGLGGGS
jgi:prolyl oligopeptidase